MSKTTKFALIVVFACQAFVRASARGAEEPPQPAAPPPPPPGGEKSYIANGRMTGGYALLTTGPAAS
jgi:hypothetical protein